MALLFVSALRAEAKRIGGLGHVARHISKKTMFSAGALHVDRAPEDVVQVLHELRSATLVLTLARQVVAVGCARCILHPRDKMNMEQITRNGENTPRTTIGYKWSRNGIYFFVPE